MKHTFTEEEGLRIAVAVLDISRGVEKDLRPLSEYMEISVEVHTRGNADGKPSYKEQSLDVHPCTEDELSKFYPLRNRSSPIDLVVRPHLQCFDSSQFKVQGDLVD